jgi:hypothetical protein
VIEDFFVQAGPLAGVAPKQTRAGSHLYRLGRLPRALAAVGERLEPRFGKLGREDKQVVFDKERLKDRPEAEWVTPGHPLFEAVREDVLERVGDDLARGAVFYDLHSPAPYLLDVFSAAVKDGRGQALHRRLFVVQSGPGGALAVRQPTVFLDLALAPKGAGTPDLPGLPDRGQLEQALLETALRPFLDEVACERRSNSSIRWTSSGVGTRRATASIRLFSAPFPALCFQATGPKQDLTPNRTVTNTLQSECCPRFRAAPDRPESLFARAPQ